MKTYCKFEDWVNANKDYYETYREIYPFLKTMSLPLSYDLVLSFYNADIINRKFTPNPQMQNCYELLFNYYVENYDRTTPVITGNTELGYLWDAIPDGIKKTTNQIADATSSLLNVTKNIAYIIMFAVVFVAVFYLILKLK